MKYANKGLRQRSDNKWEATFIFTDPATGKKRNVYKTVTAKTEIAAKRARDNLRLELEMNEGAPVRRSTVRDHLEDYLMRREKSATIEASTVSGYRTQAKTLCRYIGSKAIQDLSIRDVEMLMIRMTDDGYSPATCGKAFRLLKMALNDALADELVTRNVCNFVKPPRRPQTKINALDRVSRERMMNLIRGAGATPLSLAIEIALATGMRRGEICALRWSDLDEEGVIHVNRAFGEAGGTFYLKSAKTESSAREIPLAADTLTLLLEYKKWLKGKARDLGVAFGDPYIVGKTGLGDAPYNPTALTKEFSTFAKMNRFDCTFHDLRHTFATFMVAAGTDIATVASYLGHANVAVTLNTYATVDPEAKRAAVAKIEENLGYANR